MMTVPASIVMFRPGTTMFDSDPDRLVGAVADVEAAVALVDGVVLDRLRLADDVDPPEVVLGQDVAKAADLDRHRPAAVIEGHRPESASAGAGSPVTSTANSTSPEPVSA